MSTPVSASANSPISSIARIRPAGFEANTQSTLKTGVCGVCSGETVELSLQAQTLQQASACQCAQPVVDQGRVERLREAIENASYKVNSNRLASKMLAFERAL